MHLKSTKAYPLSLFSHTFSRIFLMENIASLQIERFQSVLPCLRFCEHDHQIALLMLYDLD